MGYSEQRQMRPNILAPSFISGNSTMGRKREDY